VPEFSSSSYVHAPQSPKKKITTRATRPTHPASTEKAPETSRTGALGDQNEHRKKQKKRHPRMRNKQPSRSISLRPPRASKNAEEKERAMRGGGKPTTARSEVQYKNKEQRRVPVCSIIASKHQTNAHYELG
jgi:hypothetical protein